jgi:hypothetical protein
MRTIFCSLLSTSLLVHAVLGCCRHQTDEADGNGALRASHLADRDSCHEDDTKPCGNDSHSPCKHPHCQGMCNYLPAQKSQVQKAQLHLRFDLPYVVNGIERQRVATSSWTLAIGPCSPQPPVRLHLLHRILLI